MKNIVLLLISLICLSLAYDLPPYCFLDEGCAVVTHCQCVWFFTYCDVSDVANGICRFTTPGIIFISTIAVIATAIVVVLICCLLCCCCGTRCCKSAKEHHTNIHYHATPYNPHENLWRVFSYEIKISFLPYHETPWTIQVCFPLTHVRFRVGRMDLGSWIVIL